MRLSRSVAAEPIWHWNFGYSGICSINLHDFPVFIQEELDALKFFGKPKLALDAVGGSCAARMSDALAEVPVLPAASDCIPCVHVTGLLTPPCHPGWVDGVPWGNVWQGCDMAVAELGVPGAAGAHLQACFANCVR